MQTPQQTQRQWDHELSLALGSIFPALSGAKRFSQMSRPGKAADSSGICPVTPLPHGDSEPWLDTIRVTPAPTPGETGTQ